MKPTKSAHRMDVLIPFRNERQNLGFLLKDFKGQQSLSSVNKFIFIDDHSSDGSGAFVLSDLGELPVELLKTKGEGKKAALKTGLRSSSENYVLTLDADVRLAEFYFDQLGRLPTKETSMVLLPVLPIVKGGLWERYAALDFLSLIGVTFSSAGWKRPVMANGANLLQKREDIEMDDATASGDDVQNLHRLKGKGASIGWSLDEALQVRTPMPSAFKELFHQRLRWAAKSSLYRDGDTLLLGWYVLLHQSSFILLLSIYSYSGQIELLGMLLLVKAILDFLFLGIIAVHFKLSELLWVFPLALLINVLMYPVIFVASRWGSYSWKDRTYTK
ncbi:MAG: glycosyltransferase [Bacteroidetes bacterium]|nr:glycosyltransferase [Bacteroidota bacterium]